jgi:hypothetical protein
MARYSNTAGQEEAPKAETKSTKNTFKADDTGAKGTKVIPYKAKETVKKSEGTPGVWGKGSDSKLPAAPAASGDFSAAEIAAGKARREKNAAAVAANPKAYAPKPAAKAAPAKPAVAKDVMVNKTTGAKYDMGKMRAAKADWESKHPSPGMKKGGVAKKKMACGGKAYAKGGLVKSSKAINGCAQRGLTKGRDR